MPLISTSAQAACNAVVGSAVRLRIYTAAYAAELANITIAFGTATNACPSVATVGDTPITASWAADGTAAAYRITNADGSTVYWEGTGAAAVATTGTPHLLLSSTAAVNGAQVQVISLTMAMPCTLAGES